MTGDDTLEAVPVPFFAGLFDSRGLVSLGPRKESSRSIGYTFDTQVGIKAYDDFHLGLVTQFLDEHDISYRINVSSADSYRVSLEAREGIKSLHRLLEGELVSKGERLAFLADSVFRAIDDGKAHMPRGYLSIVKRFNDLTPRWDHHERRKYTADYFTEEFSERFDIDPREVDPLAVPEVDSPTPPSREYLAGFLDNAGRFTMRVNRSIDYDIGYSLDPCFMLSDRWVGPRLTGFVKQFLDEEGVEYRDNSTFHHIELQVNRIDAVEQLIELVGPDLYLQYPQADFLYATGIPAYRDGYHRTKQGFYELIAAFDDLPTARMQSKRKYTAEYFEDEWAESITPVDTDPDPV